MEKNTRDFTWKSSQSGSLNGLEKKVSGKGRPFLHRRGPRVMVALLALAVLGLSAFLSLAGMKNVHAQGDCLILCLPTSTASPDASPTLTPTVTATLTPTPKPSPTSRPAPRPTPTTAPAAIASPTATVVASPSPTATAVSPTPTGTAVVVSASSLAQGNSGSPPASNALLSGALIAGSVILTSLLFFLALALVWRSVRRAFVPLANVKLPPSGARPWSRVRAPDPDDLLPAQNLPRADAQTEFLPLAPNEPPPWTL